MSQTGEVKLRFDQKMAIGEITNDLLPMIALCIPGPDSSAEDVAVDKISLVQYDPEKSITLQFDFVHPLKISSNEIPDYLFIDLS